MKKITILIACVAVFFISQAALAQDFDGKLGIGANVSYSGISDTGEGDSIKFDGAPLIGANLTYYFNKYFSFEVAIGYSQLDVEGTAAGVTIDLGELQQFPVFLSGRFHLPIRNGAVSPYFGGGVGYYFNDFDTSQIVALAGGKLDTDNSFAFHLNAGIEFFAGDHIALNLDLKYIWNEADGEFTAANIAALDDLDLNNFVGGLSLKFYF